MYKLPLLYSQTGQCKDIDQTMPVKLLENKSIITK